MKKVKVTFWIIGFGCGIVVTGIIGALLTLNVQQKEKDEVYAESPKLEESTIISPESISDESKQHNLVEDEQKKVENSAIETNENQEQNNETQEQNNVDEQVKVIQNVIIPSKLNASEICEILEKNGVVKDGDDFLKYVKEQKKQTYLKSGEYNLPVEASYDIILNKLIS